MSHKVFLVADTHFSHANICKFARSDGSKLRPWDDVSEMDEELVRRWNAVVRDQDLVYHLGDVSMGRQGLHVLSRLRGRKILIRGNHDTASDEEYLAHFEKILACLSLKGMLLTHIPIHPASLQRWGTNVHGHLHLERILDERGRIDPRYFCVSVEQIDYTPIELEELRRRIRSQKEMAGRN